MKKLFFALLMLPSIFVAAQKNSDPTTFAKTITPDALKSRLYIVAGKEMEGRETATPGQKRAAAYIESQFKAMGLLPGNHGNYQLKYPVYQDSLVNAVITVNTTPYLLDDDFTVNVGQNHNIDGKYSEVVFVGNGISDSTRDDYKGLDVKNKIVLIIPTQQPQQQGQGRGFGNPFASRIMAAQKNGAAAVFVVSGTFPRTQKTNRKGNMYLTLPNANIPDQFQVSEKIAKTILGDDYDKAKAGTLEPRSYNISAGLNFNKATTNLESSDVLGVLEGTDLKDEYVFVTGHYDHLGKRGDSIIYYGADDDGSGTCAVLQIAEAFAKAKAAGNGPRRTMVFMTVSGEEKGLWGSQYYTSNPVFPLDKTTVDLNIDMIGRTDSSRHYGDTLNYVYAVGSDKISSDLKTISEGTNKKYIGMELDYKFDDPNDRNRIYFRSDHFNFANKGVPIIFYYDGMLGADYHRPTDTPDKINYVLYAKRAQLVFYTAWDMANRDTMLKRDIPLQMPQRGF